MILLFLIQTTVTLIGVLLLLTQSTHQAMSFAGGASLMAINFLLLGMAWSLIFRKKLIALAVSLIVFKYAILGLIIYQMVQAKTVDLLWFTLGIASFVVSAITYVFVTTLRRP